MNSSRTVSLIALVIASLVPIGAFAAVAPPEESGNPPGSHPVLTNEAQMNAIVQAIDHDKRTLTLTGPDGQDLVLNADPSIKRFNKIQKGDVVQVNYKESVSLSLGPSAGVPPNGEAQSAMSAPGEKPAGSSIRTRDVMATVASVDRQNRLVTLRGPAGKDRVVRIAPDMQGFDSLKPGDPVQAHYSSAIAIKVSPTGE